MSDSPFLQRARAEWIAANELAFAIPDGYPVTPGHALVVPAYPAHRDHPFRAIVITATPLYTKPPLHDGPST